MATDGQRAGWASGAQFRRGGGVSVQVIGLDTLLSQLQQYTAATRGRLKDVINRAALQVQREAKRNCPVDTGRLRSSIAVRFYRGGYGAEVGTNVEYAMPVEYGTRHQRAQPFLGPAYETVRARLEAELKQALKG